MVAPDAGGPGVPAAPETKIKGIVMLPTESGSGAGRANLDAADRGVGAGGGGSGQGDSGGGGVGAGTSGRGGGETGLASRSGGGGSADRDAVAAILRSIRRRIEQAKTYPDAARREGTQGSVDLRFRIAADGSVEAVEILRSSGSQVLDAASQETIRRAAPYPVVQGWIRLPLSYRLAP